MKIIEAIGVQEIFPTGSEDFYALKDINLTINKGEFAGLIGPSGSGKTTFLNLSGLLLKPTSGVFKVLDVDIKDLSENQLSEMRANHIGFIFQLYYLFPAYTAYENVEYPLLLIGVEASKRKEMVMNALEMVGLTDKKNNFPSNLSGGQSQRVAIARAIVKNPKLVLADEPTANLDIKNSESILDTMQEINKKMGTTFLFSTHDHKIIDRLQRKIYLEDGKITSDSGK